jgi:hypothetical protein
MTSSTGSTSGSTAAATGSPGGSTGFSQSGAPSSGGDAPTTDAGSSAQDGGGDLTEASSAAESAADTPAEAEPASSEAGGGCPGVFCEDFEEGQIDPTRWDTEIKGGDAVTVQSQNVAHGKYAARFHGLGTPMGSSGYAYLIAKNAPAALAVHNFGRAYFYLSPKDTSIDLGLVFGGTSGFPAPTYMSLAGHSGGWQLGFIKLDGSPTGESQAYPKAAMPVNTWFCLEWEFNDQPDTIDVWGDGTAIGTLDDNDVAYPPNHPAGSIFDNKSSGLIGAFTAFGIGFYDWHPGGFDFDVYYDDVVLGTQRIGCLSP